MPPPLSTTQGVSLPILLVDDDPTQRILFTRVLEKDGHTIISAPGGKEAIELFAQHKPMLAILDAVMPEMDGFELCERLHAMEGGEQLTVLMATSLSDDADINRAFQAGAADFISKPVNWTVLRGRVKHLLQGKVAELQMREAEAQLSLSQKMSAIGNLSSGIAHEFNNILASIMGYTELLQEFLAHGGALKQKQYADEVYRSAERARDLVHQMQLFSQTRPGTAQLMQLKPLLRENLKMIRSSLLATIDLVQVLDDDLPAVMVDPAQFQQIVTNLMLNARDAIDGKGEIRLSLQQLQLPLQRCASCHQQFNGEYIALEIRDSGSGISAEVREKMFEPYYSTKPVGRGTGMGLSVVHGIMHETGGHILVQSRSGEGATFTLLFPVPTHNSVEITAMSERQTTAATASSGRRILLVDDESAITGYLSELMELHDFQVTSCNDSQQALSLFMSDPAAFDLVVTDMTLPGLTGIELASAMHHLNPKLPVVLCSGFIDEQTREQIKASGIQACFNKPVNSRSLMECIEKLLSGAGEC